MKALNLNVESVVYNSFKTVFNVCFMEWNDDFLEKRRKSHCTELNKSK